MPAAAGLELLTPPPSSPPRTLFILDSSFNPPTTAHLHLACSALASTDEVRYPRPRRLLLLLATKNADKGAVGSGAQGRVGMMKVLAGDVAAAGRAGGGEGSAAAGGGGESEDGIDIALTPHARFVEKAEAIRGESVYAEAKRVFILGFDTLARLVDTKYYDPPTLASLSVLFEGGGVRVHLRPTGEGEEGEEGQRRWVDGLGGVLQGKGGRGEWVGEIEVVAAREGAGVSSSEVRRRVSEGEGLEGLVTEGVEGVVRGEGLYRANGGS